MKEKLVALSILFLCLVGVAIWLRLPQVIARPAVDPLLRHGAEHPNWRGMFGDRNVGLGAPVSAAIIDPMVTLTGTECGAYLWEFATDPGARYVEYVGADHRVRWYRDAPREDWPDPPPSYPNCNDDAFTWRIPNVHVQHFEHGMAVGLTPKWCSMAYDLCDGVISVFADDGLFDIATGRGDDCPSYEEVGRFGNVGHNRIVNPEPQASWFARQKK